MPGVKDHLYPGLHLRTALGYLRNGKINVRNYKVIILHVGVCDILDIVNGRRSFVRHTPFHAVLCRYLDIILEIRKVNIDAIIEICGIIPVFRQHDVTKYYVMGVNNGIRLITAKMPKCVYLDTPSLFCKNFEPQGRFFEDGLHLTKVAKAILGGRIRQSLHPLQMESYFQSQKYLLLKNDYPINIFNFYSFIPREYLN